jgi:hypothetical protein
MDGFSSATVRVIGMDEDVAELQFFDDNTAIAVSTPLLFDENVLRQGVFVPVPCPLESVAFMPIDTPERFLRGRSLQMTQVISMKMDGLEGRLLIGLPFAEEYPEIFFNSELFPEGVNTAASYGMISSLTNFPEPDDGLLPTNGYPARSFFAVYHILETAFGTFFNKKATQMELQPDTEGKLALTMPPIPFQYSLINSPIPLYDVNDPFGDPVFAIRLAAHHDGGPAKALAEDDWPWVRCRQ